ncbi:SH3 domain-containing protein [Butyricicoccus sp.]|uniref:C40 family peptidase n=1 Tax=Butyricicoccus sp. TaxID=2049021 RepID=UPI002EA66EE3|nr:SH3 domain-containing protein [Butyricicoccus sp.]
MIHSKKMKFAVTTAAATAIVCTGALAANVTSTTDVNVRSGAGNSYSVLTVMKSGTTTASLGNSGKWTKVNVNGKTGYVYSKYLTSGGNTSSTPSNNGSQNVSKTVYISASSLNVRSGAGTSYSVIGNLKKGNSASVVGSTNGWYKIKYGSGYGYISSKYTTSSTPTTTTTNIAPTTSTNKTVYTTCSLNVRSGASTSYSVVGVLGSGKAASVVGTSGSWYKIKYGSGYGYISSKYTTSSAPSNGGGNNGGTVTPSNGSGSSIVSYAKSFLGCSYVYGATGPRSFDCSGFTQYVYAHFGKSIPRNSAAQYSGSKKISKSQLQAGDLIFFSNSSAGKVGHVAIYIGGGQMIHAANSKTGVCIDSINSSYYTSHYIGCGRY